MNHVYASAFPIFVIALVLMLIGAFWFHRYTGLSRDKAYLAMVASIIAGALRSVSRAKTVNQFIHQENEAEMFLGIAAAGLVVVFLTAFALRLWGRWIGGKATDAERLPGVEGIRVWFCASNVFIGAALVLCAWLGDDISPLLGTVVVGALLAAYPIIRMESPTVAVAVAAPEDLSPEREKIFSMLDSGKLTPDESAELLQALGSSARTPSTAVPLTGGQRLMLIGAALVAVGFFLPWIVVNPGKEAGRMMQQMESSMQSTFRGAIQMPAELSFAPGQMSTGNLSYSGGDIQRGLGWAALVLALASALLPYVVTALDAATARTVRLLCLGLGALIVVYLLTQNLRFVGIGLVIAVSGYALEIAGALRERRKEEGK